MSGRDDALPVVAHLTEGGRLFADAVEIDRARADRRQVARNDGSSVSPLVRQSDALALIAEKDAQIAALRDVASNKVRHVYMGMCPDELEGFDVRDPDCPACAALAPSAAPGEPT